MTDLNAEREKLKELNEQIAAMEQQRDKKAKAWFTDLLSDQLVFRRANGTVVDKCAFLKGLDDPDAFTSRKAEEIDINMLDDRALVTLIVRTTTGGGSESRYRNIRLFSKQGAEWVLQLWYNYEIPGL